LCCSATNILLCYTLAVRIVFTYVQNFVKNAEQLLFCFTSRIFREIACVRQKSLLSNILLVFFRLKSLISNVCPYLFCTGFIIVQQHPHCLNFIQLLFFFLSFCPSHLPLLNRFNNILQTGDRDFTKDISLCLST